MPKDIIPGRAPIDLFTAENFKLIKSGSYCLMIFKFIHVETCTNGSFLLLLNGFFYVDIHYCVYSQDDGHLVCF